jgi:hypothetical protein
MLPNVLDRRRVEHQREETGDVGRPVAFDEPSTSATDGTGRCDAASPSGSRRRVRPRWSAAFTRADRRAEHGGDLLQAVVEELLQDDGGALLRREALEETVPASRIAAAVSPAARGPEPARPARPLPCRAAGGVDPEVRRGAEEVGARVLDARDDAAERAERAQQGVLHQVLRIPHVARQPAAVAVQHRSEWRDDVDVAMPPALRSSRSSSMSASCPV